MDLDIMSMTFNKMHEAYDWFRDYKPLDYDLVLNIDSNAGKNVNFGDWVLFQHIKQNGYDNELKKYNYKISRPIYGICAGFNVWDQALVINILESPRAWQYTHSLVTNPTNNYTMKIAFVDAEVQNFPIWDDYIYELGHWRQKPLIGELKECLRKNKL